MHSGSESCTYASYKFIIIITLFAQYSTQNADVSHSVQNPPMFSWTFRMTRYVERETENNQRRSISFFQAILNSRCIKNVIFKKKKKLTLNV
jgi:hypothetical protein